MKRKHASTKGGTVGRTQTTTTTTTNDADDAADDDDASTPQTNAPVAPRTKTRKNAREEEDEGDDGARDEDEEEPGGADDGREQKSGAKVDGGNTEYVGVTDVDVEALRGEYARRAEACASQTGSNVEGMSGEERDRLVVEVMRYVLFSSHGSYGAPVTRAKIGEAMSAIGGAGSRNVRAGSYVVALAQKKFLDIFGYEMVEIMRAQSRNKKPAKTVEQANAAPTRCYSLRSVLPAQMRRKFVDAPDDAPQRGFAIVVAALIQISSGCIHEDALFDQLSQLGVKKEDSNHPEFGDWQAVLAALVKRRVFMRERTSYDDPSLGFSYELAEGAEAMIGYENIDKFVTEVMRPLVR